MSRRPGAAEAWPGAYDLPYSVDYRAQVMVGDGPMTLEQVGACLGVTRARVKQIEDWALLRLRDSLLEEGWEEDDVRDWLAERARENI